MWTELKDSKGNIYYFNESTGESKWDAPQWIEEKDPSTGSNYYVHYSDNKGKVYSPNDLHSTWTKPIEFAKLSRHV